MAAPNGGVYWDLNTERDSVIVTWFEVEDPAASTGTSFTFQMELRDQGNGDAEIIFRYADMGGSDPDWANGGITADPGSTLYLAHFTSGILPRTLDETLGNTGITGVWQYHIVDGVFEPNKIEDGTAGDDVMDAPPPA